MKNYVMYGHGGAYNHGAEAIVKVTIEQLRNLENREVVLSTHFKEQDEEFGIDADIFCERNMKYVQMDKESSVKYLYDKEIYADLISHINSDTVALSVGGDNYCYDNWKKWMAIHDAVKECGAKDVLWSCSIEPDKMTEDMICHLKSFDLITARETCTYEALLARGCNNVVLCADVAFLLETEETNVVNDFAESQYVAINVSPLIKRREMEEGIVIRNVVETIKDILATTDMKVLLVPHVLMSMDNDVSALREIKDSFCDEDRVVLVSNNLSVGQYKYLISKCRFGIFARTHASIAAYSSEVPAIVIGYSVKSKGIARDLGVSDYVVSVEDLRYEDQLLSLFKKLQKDEDSVNELLHTRHSMVKERALEGIHAIERIIKEKYEREDNSTFA